MTSFRARYVNQPAQKVSPLATFAMIAGLAVAAQAQTTSVGPVDLSTGQVNEGKLALSPAAAPVRAQASGGQKPEASTYSKIWATFTQWYKNDSNPVVQQVLFTGRYQQDFAAIDADQGDLEEWNVRRLRLGPRITLFRTFTLHTEVELNPQERDPFYVRLTDAYVQWNKSSRLAMTFGKQGVPFTSEGATSSRNS